MPWLELTFLFRPKNHKERGMLQLKLSFIEEDILQPEGASEQEERLLLALAGKRLAERQRPVVSVRY